MTGRRGPQTSSNAGDRKAVEFFEQNADYYHASQYRAGRRTFINCRHEVITDLLDRLAVPAGALVLDAGCGPGTLTAVFAARGFVVAAIDTSVRMLAIARSSLPADAQARASFQAASIEALPFPDESFDVVCSAGVIEYLRSYETALAEFRRVLRPGGLLILPTTNVLAFAHWFRPIQEPVARIPAVAKLFGVRPSTFRLQYHHVPKFRRKLRSAGFAIERERYFYLTLPRPLDRMFPSAARAMETFFDRRMMTWVGRLAEGYVAAARKAPRATER